MEQSLLRHDKVVVRYRTITAAQHYPLLTVQRVIRFAYRRNTTNFSMFYFGCVENNIFYGL